MERMTDTQITEWVNDIIAKMQWNRPADGYPNTRSFANFCIGYLERISNDSGSYTLEYLTETIRKIRALASEAIK